MTSPAPLGASLTTAPPRFSPEQAAQAAQTHFGLTGHFSALTSERDVNFKITSAQGSFVLKLSNPSEPLSVTAFQTEALLHLEGTAVPVPRVLRSLTGQCMVSLPEGSLRILTYLDGQMLHQAPASADLRRSLGAVAAQLSLALQDFHHPGADHILQWDIRHAASLRPLLAALPPPDRDLCQPAMDRFATDIAPALPDLPWQVVHNDLNPHNILVSEDGASVTGALDFGDMVRTARICDLAIAAGYLVEAHQPLSSLIDVASAYHAHLPLSTTEARLLIGLVETRWLTTLCIAQARAARNPQNAAYILRNAPQARAGLQAFARMNRAQANDTLLTALRLP